MNGKKSVLSEGFCFLGKLSLKIKYNIKKGYCMIISENQRKSPSFRHTLKQSAFRSSFNPSKSFGGVTAGFKATSKKFDKKKK